MWANVEENRASSSPPFLSARKCKNGGKEGSRRCERLEGGKAEGRKNRVEKDVATIFET